MTAYVIPRDNFPQIGEPRLDSGFIVQEQIRPPFNPLTPLLRRKNFVGYLTDRWATKYVDPAFLMNNTDSLASDTDRGASRGPIVLLIRVDKPKFISNRRPETQPA
jgi:hypothetical protein